MNRRSFLRTAMAATASGLLVPEWLLDPPKGRSMVAVPEMPIYRINGKRGRIWYIGYSVNGKEIRESSRSTVKEDAKALLRARSEHARSIRIPLE